MEENQTQAPLCQNCGTPIEDKYCPQCGQQIKKLNPSLKEFLVEILGDAFAFDSRLFRTIKPLFLKPGKLTLEYNQGHRVRYVPPGRMYLFVSFLLFFTIAISGFEVVTVSDNDGNGNIKISTDEADSTVTESTGDFYLINDDEKGFFDDYLKNFGKKAAKAQENKALINSFFMEHFPQLMFLLLPLFALLLKLVYIRTKRVYYHHLIFSLHLHSFVFLMLFFAVLFYAFSGFNAVSIGIFIGIIYLFISMKNVYQQKFWKTFAKFILVGIAYLVLFSFSMLALILLSILQIGSA